MRRSSKVTTGTLTTVASAAASSMAACAAGPDEPFMFSGRPTTTISASSSITRLGDRQVVAPHAATALQHVQRGRDGAGSVGDRDPDPLRPEVETQSAAGRATSPVGRLRSDPQRLVETFGVLSTGGGDVALSAASAADSLGRVLDEVAGHLAGLGGDRGHQ